MSDYLGPLTRPLVQTYGDNARSRVAVSATFPTWLPFSLATVVVLSILAIHLAIGVAAYALSRKHIQRLTASSQHLASASVLVSRSAQAPYTETSMPPSLDWSYQALHQEQYANRSESSDRTLYRLGREWRRAASGCHRRFLERIADKVRAVLYPLRGRARLVVRMSARLYSHRWSCSPPFSRCFAHVT